MHLSKTNFEGLQLITVDKKVDLRGEFTRLDLRNNSITALNKFLQERPECVTDTNHSVKAIIPEVLVAILSDRINYYFTI